jgi:hypothetical protein
MQLSVIRMLPDLRALKDEWNELLFSSASHVPFLRNEYLCSWWGGKGEGRKAAGYLNLDYDDQISVYNSGYDPEFREISPGWVLLAYLIKLANEKGYSNFDFLRGNEEYKYRFGAIDRRVLRAKVSCP